MRQLWEGGSRDLCCGIRSVRRFEVGSFRVGTGELQCARVCFGAKLNRQRQDLMRM
jgi:hypothetical protein